MDLDFQEFLKVVRHAREIGSLELDAGGVYLATRCQTSAEQICLGPALVLGTQYECARTGDQYGHNGCVLLGIRMNMSQCMEIEGFVVQRWFAWKVGGTGTCLEIQGGIVVQGCPPGCLLGSNPGTTFSLIQGKIKAMVRAWDRLEGTLLLKAVMGE